MRSDDKANIKYFIGDKEVTAEEMMKKFMERTGKSKSTLEGRYKEYKKTIDDNQ